MPEFLDWSAVIGFYAKHPNLVTKTGNAVPISRISRTALYVALPGGEQSVSRKNLEAAVALLGRGETIDGPGEYRAKVADERPAYAWAVLRDFGFVG